MDLHEARSLDEHVNREEIERNVQLARRGLDAMGAAYDDLPTSLMDGIATLLILAHETDQNVADIVQRGTAHYLATYMEHMSADKVQEWVSATLFPWTGDNQFAWYVAREAISLSGHAGNVDIPEWGV